MVDTSATGATQHAGSSRSRNLDFAITRIHGRGICNLGFQPPLKQWVFSYNHHWYTLWVLICLICLIIEIGEETIVLMVVEAQGKRVYLLISHTKIHRIHGLVAGKPTYPLVRPIWEWTVPIGGPVVEADASLPGFRSNKALLFKAGTVSRMGLGRLDHGSHMGVMPMLWLGERNFI